MSNDHDEGPEGAEDDAASEVDANLSPGAEEPTADDAVEDVAADAEGVSADTDPADDAVADSSDADADSSDGDDEDALVGAGVAAGSARAAARRSAVVKAGVSESKGRATARRDDAHAEGGNIFSRLGRWVRQIVDELRKVIWPGRKQMITYTIVVLVFVVLMTALIGGLDWVFAKGVLAVFG